VRSHNSPRNARARMACAAFSSRCRATFTAASMASACFEQRVDALRGDDVVLFLPHPAWPFL
jgi:hypothetical protein